MKTNDWVQLGPDNDYRIGRVYRVSKDCVLLNPVVWVNGTHVVLTDSLLREKVAKAAIVETLTKEQALVRLQA